MTKTNLHITIIFTVFFLSLNLISQNREQKIVFSPIDRISDLLYNSENNIKVISILDTDNSVALKRLDQFAAKYEEKNVTFIAITDGLNDSISNAIKNEFVHYQHLPENENKKIFNTYQTGKYKIFPIHIILNKEGKIIYKKKGSVNNIEEKLSKRIDKSLNLYGKEAKLQKLQYTVR